MSESPHSKIKNWLMRRVDSLIVAIPGLDTWHGREARLFYYVIEHDHRPDSVDIWYELHIRVQNVERQRQCRTHIIRVAYPSGRLEMDASASMTFFGPPRPADHMSSAPCFLERRLRAQEERSGLTRCSRAFLERISPDLQGPLASARLALRHGLRHRYRELGQMSDVTGSRRLS